MARLIAFCRTSQQSIQRKRIRILTNGTANIAKMIELQQHCRLIISLHHEYVTDKLLNKFLKFLEQTP